MYDSTLTTMQNEINHARQSVIDAEADAADATTRWIYTKDAGEPTMASWRLVQSARAAVTASKKYENEVHEKAAQRRRLGLDNITY